MGGNSTNRLLQRPQPGDSGDPASDTDGRPRVVPGPTMMGQMQRPQADASPKSEPPHARESTTSTAAQTGAAKSASRRKPIFLGIGALALMGLAYYGYEYITVGRFLVSTDDAYVGAYMSIISPKIPAIVAEVPIVDNQPVKEGQTLVKLDDGDYRLALEQAQSKLATQLAAIKTFDAQIRAAEATSAQARAQLDAGKANVVKTEADFKRTDALTAKDYATKASLDAAIAARDSAVAQVKSNEAAIESADANVALLHAQRDQAEKVAKELQVAVAQAARDLSFTVIRAPFDGVIGNRGVQVGDYVTPGKRLAAVVPLDKVFVDANFKETQLPEIVPGQTATIRVDSLNGEALKGTVEGVSPASGSKFSLLPPENATGNFTKIVQRVPVRITIPASTTHDKLRPGLSVVVSVDTRTSPKDAGHDQAALR